ncbi:MAG: nucleoside triphosphate pyrophosphohydrolase [Bacteroidales bacterium]|jgi:XTP/dITP diphosphohydrolase|nr:nucleoside triphosphate pyrophosphohydrolase [Bacteroidales bacterium]MBQ2514431.1 nucleoside triphosphate pyrophosphohydrolase [Bacteroidales bacterium]MBR6174256.1 nucleoside triphosphate pyrophosphohydrolase [Bacteroidales bacterium]MCR4871944.1 nucleoside triphosphate pyrophosphohydrolase [Bacteroidales bacterium]
MEQTDKYAEALAAFRHLLEIMDELREKCPWDRAQTFETLRNLTVEETFELADAIMDKDYPDMCKELGDLQLHIVFYAKVASEMGLFNVTDVLNKLCDKLIRRHPHIYGEMKADSANEVHENWEKIKLQTEGNRSVLGGIPSGMPALTKAYRIQDKVSGVGFDWDNKEDVWAKVQEEVGELKAEVDAGNHDRVEEEFGDVLFSLINYARFLDVHPEDALEKTNRKFMHRFQLLEQMVKADGRSLPDMSLAEMDEYWERAKREPVS